MPSIELGRELGKYRVLELIGMGSMAEVYKGYHPMLDRYVAIKVLLAHLINDGAFVERFQREAAAVARLRHTNIVQVHDFGIYEDISYMVMEFIPGVTLKDRMTALRVKGDRMPVRDVLAFTWELASALDHAHANGLVHRDVKPANILLPREGGAKLTDFGVAHVAGSSLTIVGSLVGLAWSLVTFNVGVEAGQLAVVLVLLPISLALAKWKHGPRAKIAISISSSPKLLPSRNSAR